MSMTLAGKNILIRADAAPEIGSGHIMRTLVLARLLKTQGAHITYACRTFQGNMIKRIKDEGFSAIELAPEADHALDQKNSQSWLGGSIENDLANTFLNNTAYDLIIADHYGINLEWCQKAREYSKVIFCIDDEAERTLDCDILLNQNYYPLKANLYTDKLPPKCQQLVGPEFALLRPEFTNKRTEAQLRNGLDNILIISGGADYYGIALNAAKHLHDLAQLTMVVGETSKDLETLKSLYEPQGHKVITYTNAVEDLMLEADFCIGAGGSTSWERCCLKLPAALVSIADNQIKIAENLNQANAAYYLGKCEDTNWNKLREIVQDLKSNPEKLTRMSEAAGKICDGQGAARVLETVKTAIN